MYKFNRGSIPPNVEDWKRIDLNLKNRDRFLEVGVAEGRSIVQSAKLFHTNTEMYCVDSWASAEEGEENFDHNISILQQTYPNKFHKIKQKSIEALPTFIHQKLSFDFIYIDSNKHGRSIIEDFSMSFLILNKGGILMFDDYYLDREQDPIEDSKMALNMVMFQYQKYINVIHKGKRCIVKRIN